MSCIADTAVSGCDERTCHCLARMCAGLL